MNENENTATATPVVEGETTKVETTTTKVAETKVENGGKDPVITKDDDNKVNYVKERVDRAKEQTTKTILKELGVENLDDAKKVIADGTKALDEVAKLKAKLEAKEHDEEVATKKQLLTKVLDNEKVFDSDALINYLDLDKVKVENGEIVDAENIVASLKKAKPNFFGKFETVSDGYVKGQTSKPTTALDKQKAGDTIGAINDYLKTILK